jgi:hypothetical protein
MKAVIDRVAAPRRLTLHVVDISADEDLEAQYGLEIPVLVIDGRKTAKYRITEDALTRALDRRGE